MLRDQVNEICGRQFYGNAPAAMRAELVRTGDVKEFCDERIRKARKKSGGKLTIKKNGAVIDENNHRVEAFAFEFGRFEVDRTLYRGIVADTLHRGTVHLLLIRSDVTKPLHTLFPDIGTAQDWRILQKCMDRFSPKASSHRYVVDVREAHHAATKTAAITYLEQSGALQQCDLATLQDMDTAKMHLIDLGAIVALEAAFPADLAPQMIHVVLTRDRDADDLEEVHRVLKAMDFTTGISSPGLHVPAILVKGKSGLETWRKSARFAYITYDSPQGIECLFTALSQALALNDIPFSKQFPHTPVVVGPNIWSDRTCTEIDARGLRFTDEELLVGRKYIAALIKHQGLLMDKLSQAWPQSITAQEAAVTPYPQLWFRTFHLAAGQTLFPASSAFLDYLEFTRAVDAGRLRLRNDRKERYAKAIDKLKTATRETPWICRTRPRTLSNALALLAGEYDAFLHQKDGRPVLAFTEASLIRCAGLEQGEMDDFVSELKRNRFLTNKTHPITFANREQHRFICVSAPSLTVTDEGRKEDVA